MGSSVKSTRGTETTQIVRAPWQIGLVLVAVVLGLYGRTLAPGLLMGDPGEFHFAAWRLGLAHPTGYPLYLILGGLWQRLAALLGVDPPLALNAFSAVTGAATAGLLYWLMVRWLPAAGVWSHLAALFSALLFACNPTVWSQSVIAEVYALHALLILAVMVAGGRWQVAGGRWRVAGGRGQGAGGRWQVAEGRWQRAGSRWQHPGGTGGGREARGQGVNRQVDQLTGHSFTLSSGRLVVLSAVLGLALAHHRTALFLLPGVGLLLFWLDPTWWRRWRLVVGMLLALLLPQLLYLYIPLRSGPDASPWLYQPLNGETLVLYEQSWRGFWRFVTGQVFAVSFLGLDGALARLPQMADLWLRHFNWTGLALMLLGLVFLVRRRQWPVLLLTLPFALLLQIFNLFYGIGDIYVFYIPLYLVGSIWAGFGGWVVAGGRWQVAGGRWQVAGGGWQVAGDGRAKGEGEERWVSRTMRYGLWIVLFGVLAVFTLVPLFRFYADVDRSGDTAARQLWAAILGADPPPDAILVSNDRNEMVPLYYLQAVEGVAQGMTGLFPQLTPAARFADVGAVIETALAAGDRPVYLIKPMAGLEVRFDLAAATAPLVRVTGSVDAESMENRLDGPLGPLTLLGYDWQVEGDRAEIVLYWRVEEAVDANYTTTVQVFDAAGGRIAQEDRPPGGVFYPTSLWKPGEILRERHVLALNGGAPVRVLAGLYRRPAASAEATQPEFLYLAPPLEWDLSHSSLQ